MKTLIFIIAVLSASPALAGNCNLVGVCSTVHHKQNFVKAHHGYRAGVYYVAGGQYAQAESYKSFAQQVAEATADEFERRGIATQTFTAESKAPGWALKKYCGTCHGEGKPNEGSFALSEPIDYAKASYLRDAVRGKLDGVPSMAAKAKIDQNNAALDAVFDDLEAIPRVAAQVKPQVEGE